MDKVDDLLQPAIRQLFAEPVADSEVPDVAGRVRYWEQELARYRRGLIAETGEQEGEHWRLIEARAAKRSFNGAAILSTVMDGENVGPFPALQELLDAGAVKLAWQWTGLRTFFAQHRLTLRVGQDEVYDDLDGPHVGEVWSSSMRVEPKT